LALSGDAVGASRRATNEKFVAVVASAGVLALSVATETPIGHSVTLHPNYRYMRNPESKSAKTGGTPRTAKNTSRHEQVAAGQTRNASHSVARGSVAPLP
jgi:hypothetical protein